MLGVGLGVPVGVSTLVVSVAGVQSRQGALSSKGQALPIQGGNEVVQDIAPHQHIGPVGCHAANSRDVEAFDNHHP